MGYPRLLQLLIIEDETPMVEAYKGYVDKLAKSRPLAPPCIVQSYADAIEHLSRNDVFHLVVLDLRLPEQAGGEADQNSSRGLELVQQIADRDHSPIPVLAIVTGDPGRITKFAPLQKQLQEGFWHGNIVKKSLDLIEDLIQVIDKALEYVDVGLIVRDAANEVRPVLTLRDEDLLRRATLSRQAAGLELSWWSAQRRDLGAQSSPPRWAKVFQGRFLVPSDGLSRPHFFKLEPTDDGARAHASAVRMDSKLQHIKVIGHWASSSTSLLVTGKAGPSDDPPISIGDFLRHPSEEVVPVVDQLASDIATQLRSFPKTAPQQVPLRMLLWSPIGVDRRAYLLDVERKVQLPHPSAASVFDQLSSSDRMFWVDKRRCHGDLHTGNVSLDHDGNMIRAFIIDAGALEDVVCSSDLAALEVSLILHEEHGANGGLLDSGTAIAFFDGSSPLADLKLPSDLPTELKNSLALISAVRGQALSECNEDIYAVLLMDQVLVQLSGLAFGTTQNKIKRPVEVVQLFALLTKWLERSGIIKQ